jgi:hypothetical protein
VALFGSLSSHSNFFLKKQRNREVVGERWHVQQAEQKKTKGP